jgi:large subunit ribosomal protein L30
MAGKLRVTLRKSVVSGTRETRGTVRALGLHRIGETVELPDNPAVRGQIRAVRHLVSVEESPAAGTSKKGGRARPTEETES